ncbi:MAG: PHP domain-containing protein [Candidatus Aenigmarchaeota archaeon]|nr:PHP domain-containing protein [Candidatus Aenigmarchaeota archaeon]
MLIETHCHTVYSKQMKIKWEGTNTPAEMVERAKNLGIGALCITDHDNIKAWPEAIEAGKKHGVFVVPGTEISSADGHILGLGLNELIPKKLSAEETIDRIHQQGGFAIAAHPFDIKGLGIQDKIKYADGIEIFNSLNVDKVANWLTKRKSKDLGKPLFAGSDAHSADMLGMSLNEISGDVHTVDDFISALKNGKVSIAKSDYQPANVIIEWTRERMARSYFDIVDYVNMHYWAPKMQLSKFMLNRFVYSKSRTLDYTWKAMAEFAFRMSTVYGGLKLLI